MVPPPPFLPRFLITSINWLVLSLIVFVSRSWAGYTRLDPITVVSAAEDYLPVSDPEITWDKVDLEYLGTSFNVTDGGDLDCRYNFDIQVNLKFRAANKIVYRTAWHHYEYNYQGGVSCSGGNTFAYPDLLRAKRLIGPGEPDFSNNDWVIETEFRSEYAHILAAINNQIASLQGGLPLPSPNPNDNRKLAVPVLFIHGKGDSVERWGVSFARRECKSPFILNVIGPQLSSTAYPSTERRQKTEINPVSGLVEPVFFVDESGNKIPEMVDVPVTRFSTAFVVTGMDADCDDGVPMTSYRVFGLPWYPPNGGIPGVANDPVVAPEFLKPVFDPVSKRIRVVIAMPSTLVVGLREVPDLLAELSLLQTDETGKFDSPMPFAPGYGAQWHLTETVNSNGSSWSLYRQDLSLQDFAPFAWFVEELSNLPFASGEVLRNGETMDRVRVRAQNEGLVSTYADGSAPDILARIEHLDRRYRWWDPYAGINNNGIYFFSAVNDLTGEYGSVPRIGAPPAAWNPLSYTNFLSRYNSKSLVTFEKYVNGQSSTSKQNGYFGRGQSFQLYQRIVEVLDTHYPNGWRDNPDAKIDLVAHSQGGLLVRDMLAHQNDLQLPDGTPMPLGSAHPGAHIRKFVVLNTPHFGSPFADKEAEIATEYGSILRLKDWIKNEDVLRNWSNLDLTAYRDAIAASAGGTGCGVGAFIGGPAGCIIGGGIGLAVTSPWVPEGEWRLRGKALGPYYLDVDVDRGPGLDDIEQSNTIDPQALRQIREHLVGAEPLSYDVGTKSAWIAELKRAGYPALPAVAGQVGVPLWTQPLYTPGMPRLRTDIGTELMRIQQEYCDDHADDWVETCEIVSWMLNGVAVMNAEDQGKFYTFFRDFHNEWSSKSDLVVDAASQSMVLPGLGFDPLLPTLLDRFQPPQDFPLQKEFGTGSAKEVAHVSINQVLDLTLPSAKPPIGVTSSSHRFELRRPGAPRMGPDIYAALYDDEFIRAGIRPVAPHAEPVSLPILVNTSSSAGRLAGDLGIAIQDVATTGDFRVQAWSQDPLVQGVGVRLSPTGPLVVAAFYDRRQGAFLWANNSLFPGGQKVALGNSEAPPRLSLQREGSLWIAKAEFQGGASKTAQLVMPISLSSTLRVGVLSSAEGRQAAVTPPALLGLLNSLPDPSVDLYREWSLITYLREQSATANQSNPRLAVHNADSRSLRGVYLEYWFTADPARKPVVEFDRSAGVSWEVVHHGGTQYVLKMSAPSAVVAAGGVFPDADGISFRIHNQDGAPRWNQGDWSRDRNIGVAQATQRVVVRNVEGRILAGEVPPALDLGKAARIRVWARDAGATEANHLKPELRIRNLGSVPLDNYTVQWIVRVPDGVVPLLDDWSQVATIGLQRLGQGLWRIEARFDRYILFPQQESPTLKIGLHLPNWPAWNKAGSPSNVGADWVEHQGVVVLDGKGRRLWGNLPEFLAVLPEVGPPTDPTGDLGALDIQAREEQPVDKIYARPRVRVENQGTATVKGFQLGLWIHAEGASPLLLDATWYAPGCAVSVAPVGVGQKLTYSCPDVTLAPGATWPDPAGSVVGLHLPQWQEWIRDASWSLSGLTGSFAPTDRITIETPTGEVVKGLAP